MKPRKPAVVRNTSCSKSIEVEWNLPVRLDALTDYTVSGGKPEAVAEGIFDAATALACAKGTWYGQDSIQPIVDEVALSLAFVSSAVFEDPHQVENGEITPGNQDRVKRAGECLSSILALLDKSA